MAALALVPERLPNAHRACRAHGPRRPSRPLRYWTGLVAHGACLEALGDCETPVDHLDEFAARRAAAHPAQCLLAYDLDTARAVARRRAWRWRTTAWQLRRLPRQVRPADGALKCARLLQHNRGQIRWLERQLPATELDSSPPLAGIPREYRATPAVELRLADEATKLDPRADERGASCIARSPPGGFPATAPCHHGQHRLGSPAGRAAGRRAHICRHMRGGALMRRGGAHPVWRPDN